MNTTWNVTIYPDSPEIHVVHLSEDEDGPPWSGTVRIHRGADTWDSHPELAAAAKSIMVPEAHAGAFTKPWTYELPERYLGVWNAGPALRYMVLKGGALGWTLALLFPPRTPLFVYARVAKGFRAELVTAEKRADPHPEPKTRPAMARLRRRR